MCSTDENRMKKWLNSVKGSIAQLEHRQHVCSQLRQLMGSCLCMYTWRLHIVSWSKKLYLVTFRSRLGLYHSRLGLLLTLTLFENWQIIATLLPKTKSYTEIYILKIGLISACQSFKIQQSQSSSPRRTKQNPIVLVLQSSTQDYQSQSCLGLGLKD